MCVTKRSPCETKAGVCMCEYESRRLYVCNEMRRVWDEMRCLCVTKQRREAFVCNESRSLCEMEAGVCVYRDEASLWNGSTRPCV